jgi:hypothetical protein
MCYRGVTGLGSKGAPLPETIRAAMVVPSPVIATTSAVVCYICAMRELLRWPWRHAISKTPFMRSHRYPHTRPAPPSAFAGYRFPLEVITLAIGWYLRFGLSYRDVEELLAERGIEVDHVTVYRWVQRFAPEFAEAAASRRHVVGDRWHVDETYLKVGGTWRYLFRAIDQFGQVIDVVLSPRRNKEAGPAVLRPSDRPDPDLSGGGHHRPVPGLPPRHRRAAAGSVP